MCVLGLCCCTRASSGCGAWGYSSSQSANSSLLWFLLLRSTGSGLAGSVVVMHGLSCSTACGIFPHQGSNLYPLHWQVDSLPLSHQGSPVPDFEDITMKKNSGYLANNFLPSVEMIINYIYIYIYIYTYTNRIK